jgi:hypothetical protein
MNTWNTKLFVLNFETASVAQHPIDQEPVNRGAAINSLLNLEYRTCSLPNTMMKQCVLLFILVASADAFMISPGASQRRGLATTFTSTVSLQMAGFGAAPKKGDKKKSVVLKAKQQWDRYLALKKSESFAVAVKIADAPMTSSSDGLLGWLQVGIVRSKDNAYTEEAVTRQRLLIAEHARRCYPLQVLAKDKLEWAYLNKEDQLIVIGKNDHPWHTAEMPDGIEKMIGFVGVPDKSGFYAKSREGESTKPQTKKITIAPP